MNIKALLQKTTTCRPESYRPQDLFPTPEAVESVRRWFVRSAQRDGLNAEAAEEAASVALMAWMTRDYSASDVARGDHPRALFETRRYMRKSRWIGGTEYRRGQLYRSAPCTGSEASRTPTPDAILAALEAAQKRGLSYVPFREKWARRGWRKRGRGPQANFERTGRKDHRDIRRSLLPARLVIAEAARVGGLLAVFMPQEE